MKVAVITAIYDRFDELKPIEITQEGVDVDYVFVTDDRDLESTWSHLGWRVVYEPRPGVHPCRAAKRPKMRPQDYTNADHSVWIDGSFRIIDSHAVVDMLQVAAESRYGVAQFRHPWRQCWLDEAYASLDLAKYAGESELIDKQIADYEYIVPTKRGLWATGVIARYDHDQHVDWGKHWYRQCLQYSYQDQISHPIVCWFEGIWPGDLPGSHMHNQWVRYEGSARHG